MGNVGGEPVTTRPVLIFDGRCGFCRFSVAWLHARTGDAVEYLPAEDTGARFPALSPGALARAVHLVEPDGRMSTAAEAVFRTLQLGAGRRLPLAVYSHVPLARPVAELGYRVVALSRPILTPLMRVLYGRDLAPSTYHTTRRVLERGLAAIYLIAFLSLWVQIIGLVGERGILPAGEFLRAVEQRAGASRFELYPTLAWFGSSDRALHLMCGGGVALSLLALLRVLPGQCFLGMWVLYLSLTIVGQTFLHFQWDSLLLEAGLLAVFLAPWRIIARRGAEPPPSRCFIWLFRCLLFRLMFLSGMTKLLSGDHSWRDLTALNYHYWTQCIPNRLAWYVDKLPEAVGKFSIASMFFIELVLPFFIFLPRVPRLLAFWGLTLLQVMIILTGNYNFFNWLTIVLCFSLLDDRAWIRVWPKGALTAPAQSTRRWWLWTTRAVRMPVALVIVLVSTLHLWGTLTKYDRLPAWAMTVVRGASPFRSCNSYGLFRVMTKSRPEIIIEGSRDGREWKAYEFWWKPGDLGRAPGYCAPHQPRLDWQMWFAALGDYRRNGWLLQLMDRFLENEPAVLRLIRFNPFPDEPPRYVRAVAWDYRFTTWAERAATGDWWHREKQRPYAPVRRR